MLSNHLSLAQIERKVLNYNFKDLERWFYSITISRSEIHLQGSNPDIIVKKDRRNFMYQEYKNCKWFKTDLRESTFKRRRISITFEADGKTLDKWVK